MELENVDCHAELLPEAAASLQAGVSASPLLIKEILKQVQDDV